MSTSLCLKCVQIQKKIKMVTADYQFEIKKIQQDKSTEKAMYEIHLQKQVRRWQQMYQKQKSMREDEIKNWMQKYDSTVLKYQNQLSLLTQKHRKELKNTIQALTNETRQKINKLDCQYEKKIKIIEQNNQKFIENLKNQNLLKIKEIINQNQNSLNSIKKTHKNQLEMKIRNYQSRILGAQSEKIKQVKLHEETKSESKDIQAKLYQQIFYLRKDVSQLQTKIQQHVKMINSKQQNINELNQNILKLKSQHQEQMEKIRKTYENNIEQIKDEYKLKLSSLYEQNINSCSKYQNILQKIQEKRQSQKTIYLNSLQQISSFVESRASRPQDIEEIQALRQVLSKKTKQCQCLAQQLRFFRLQLENKEQTYNKIFVPIANPNNENIIYKRKQFKLRRQGRSVTTVRQALQSIQSANVQKKTTNLFPPKPKLL